MAAPTVITVTNGILTLADTEAGLATGENFECQVTEAAINASPNLQTVPATFCEPESQSPAATGYELAITWLQDWTIMGGLSKYAFDNDTATKWFSLALTAGATPLATGQVRVVAGSYGGAAGTPLSTSSTWPLAGKPSISVPLTAEPLTADAEAHQETDEPDADVKDADPKASTSKAAKKSTASTAA